MPHASSLEGRVLAGRDALQRGAWEEARRLFESALSERESPAAWEGLAWAAWWLDDGAQVLEARERAYRLHRDAGDARGAARAAVWLGNDFFEFRAADAVAGGWFDRAARLLEELEPGAEHGWLAVLSAYFALEEGDSARARQLATEARDLGRSLGLVGLEMLAVATEGLARVSEGEVAAGMRMLDEAAAAALSGDYEELPGAAWTCCYMIYACERVRDYDRAAQWAREVEQFAERRRMTFLRGTCRAHYGAVLVWHGRWGEAEELLAAATADLGRRPYWDSEAIVALADLRRRQGRLDEARALLARGERHPSARFATAELCLDRGEPDGALRAVEDARRAPAENVMLRAAVADVATRALVMRGDLEAARASAAELRSAAAEVGTKGLLGAAAMAAGLLAAAAGDHQLARSELDAAAGLFREGDAPFEEARARAELGSALAALGDAEAAEREARAAQELLRGLGAAGRERGQGVLSPRELEVLALVAEGRRDREIADALTISEHTVHRHMANVLAKLRCPTRAAAVAEAGRLGLL